MLQNTLTGVKYGVASGWITLIGAGYVLNSDSANQISLIIAYIFGWAPGIIGGAIGGVVGGLTGDPKNVSRGGIVGGVATSLALSANTLWDFYHPYQEKKRIISE